MNLETLPVGLFDTIPIWIIWLSFILILLVSFEIGYQICKYTSSRDDKEGFNSLGTMVGGLLAMLAFVLAFTFSMASSQHNLRKQDVLNEANVIRTAYARADLLGERDAIKIKLLLKEYVDTRVYAIEARDKNLIKRMLKRSLEIHNLLWTKTVSSAKKNPDLHVELLMQSINNIANNHENRVTAGFYNRIPSSMWLILLIISVLTIMTMGTQMRLSKERRLAAVIPLIIAFSALTTLVLDLDRPQDGMITVGQEAMIDLQKSMNTKLQ